MLDKTYDEYQQQIQTKLSELTIRETIDQLQPLELFIWDRQGEWKPRRHAGYTLITPNFPDDAVNIKAYVHLGDTQQRFFGKLESGQYVLAPVSAFHLTVARLVSGPEYEKRIMGRQDQFFIETLAKEFRQFPSFKSIEMMIRGVSVLPGGFIAALLEAAQEDDYQRLLSFRNQLYGNGTLKSFGVEPKRPFIGHVTLAYIQARLNQENRNNLLETIQTINQRYFATPVPFEITQAEVRKFDHYLKFDREPSWPVVQFPTEKSNNKRRGN